MENHKIILVASPVSSCALQRKERNMCRRWMRFCSFITKAIVSSPVITLRGDWGCYISCCVATFVCVCAKKIEWLQMVTLVTMTMGHGTWRSSTFLTLQSTENRLFCAIWNRLQSFTFAGITFSFVNKEDEKKNAQRLRTMWPYKILTALGLITLQFYMKYGPAIFCAGGTRLKILFHLRHECAWVLQQNWK